jgi:4'-phosphopantetheinyl transferase
MLEHNSQKATAVPLDLPVDRVDVWTVPLFVADDRVAALAECLSPDERERAARFVFEKDRRRFIVGRGALRSILAAYISSAPPSIRFEYAEHGKPSLAAPAEKYRSLEFNASGSDELAVCAVTVDRKVGVDIELLRPSHDETVVEQCFAPAERQALGALPAQEKTAAFYRLWTLKEAYLKARGAGLSQPLSSFEVCFMPGQPVRLKADHFLAGSGNDWTFVEFQAAPTHAGAIVISGDERPLVPRHWSP